MKNRIICLSLCVVMFVTALLSPVSAIDLSELVEQARRESQVAELPGTTGEPENDPDEYENLEDYRDPDEAEDPEDYGDPDRLRTSEAGIALIKEFEDFSPELVLDVGSWAIGYGTHCDPDDYPDGITEEEADKLMRRTLAPIEEYLTRYIKRNNITLTQEQFDAIASLTYNLGTAMVSKEYRFWSMLSSGIGSYSDTEIASSIGVFCHIGTQINTALLDRRIREAQLFLYGDYTGRNCPGIYYVIFDGNGGRLETDVRLYTAGDIYHSFPSVTGYGYYFGGWYTSTGIQITTDTKAEQNLRVTALWTDKPQTQKPVDTHFSDVKVSDWYSSYVRDLFEDGIIGGYSDNTFRPNAHVSIGEALKMILLSIGFPEQPKEEHWADGYQNIALEYGFLDENDVASGLNAPASRALIAKLTANALGLRRGDIPSPFADSDDDFVVAMYQAKIIEGSIDSSTGKRMFYPGNPINRAEIAKIVWTLCQTVRNP